MKSRWQIANMKMEICLMVLAYLHLRNMFFVKGEKMLKALKIDYEHNKVKVDLLKIYPNPSAPLGTSIDIAETLSNLTGKWIKKISDPEVEFE